MTITNHTDMTYYQSLFMHGVNGYYQMLRHLQQVDMLKST